MLSPTDHQQSVTDHTPFITRLAPTPTGLLHLGHARTFAATHRLARDAGGRVHLRIEDLDTARCRPEFTEAAIDDLRWLGLDWDGEIIYQSQRRASYETAWTRLRDRDLIYPCSRSRKDVRDAALAPHAEDEEPLYPVAWRPAVGAATDHLSPLGLNWRLRVPDGEAITFDDGRIGPTTFVAGDDFGDFLVWNRDNIPAYELAVVVDDIAMGITEVIRGEDLLLSTARQILIYRALGARPPKFRHLPLVLDENGRRLAKRHAALSLHTLRERGTEPSDVARQKCFRWKRQNLFRFR
ncbi:MAG: tRNA glutamyl-Q(34) synthetase GluQRS [Chthoniobacterales bacterium]